MGFLYIFSLHDTGVYLLVLIFLSRELSEFESFVNYGRSKTLPFYQLQRIRISCMFINLNLVQRIFLVQIAIINVSIYAENVRKAKKISGKEV